MPAVDPLPDSGTYPVAGRTAGSWPGPPDCLPGRRSPPRNICFLPAAAVVVAVGPVGCAVGRGVGILTISINVKAI